MVRCFRCPIAYHSGDGCIAAGSLFVSSHILICSNHSKRSHSSSAVNVGFCFVCARGEHTLVLFPFSFILLWSLKCLKIYLYLFHEVLGRALGDLNVACEFWFDLIWIWVLFVCFWFIFWSAVVIKLSFATLLHNQTSETGTQKAQLVLPVGKSCIPNPQIPTFAKWEGMLGSYLLAFKQKEILSPLTNF